ncbi:MAG: ATP synthase F0 subunit C [Myxococcota bacterium]
MKKLIVSMFSILPVLLFALPAFAEAGADKAAANGYLGYVALAAGICMGAAAFGGAMGQSRAAAAALEGIARNPQAAPRVQTPMLIALALMESLVLFAFVIAFFLVGALG